MTDAPEWDDRRPVRSLLRTLRSIGRSVDEVDRRTREHAAELERIEHAVRAGDPLELTDASCLALGRYDADVIAAATRMTAARDDRDVPPHVAISRADHGATLPGTVRHLRALGITTTTSLVGVVRPNVDLLVHVARLGGIADRLERLEHGNPVPDDEQDHRPVVGMWAIDGVRTLLDLEHLGGPAAMLARDRLESSDTGRTYGREHLEHWASGWAAHPPAPPGEPTAR